MQWTSNELLQTHEGVLSNGNIGITYLHHDPATGITLGIEVDLAAAAPLMRSTPFAAVSYLLHSDGTLLAASELPSVKLQAGLKPLEASSATASSAAVLPRQIGTSLSTWNASGVPPAACANNLPLFMISEPDWWGALRGEPLVMALGLLEPFNTVMVAACDSHQGWFRFAFASWVVCMTVAMILGVWIMGIVLRQATQEASQRGWGQRWTECIFFALVVVLAIVGISTYDLYTNAHKDNVNDLAMLVTRNINSPIDILLSASISGAAHAALAWKEYGSPTTELGSLKLMMERVLLEQEQYGVTSVQFGTHFGGLIMLRRCPAATGGVCVLERKNAESCVEVGGMYGGPCHCGV